MLRDAVIEVVEKETLAYNRKVCRILPASLDSNLGDVAALSIVMDSFYDS